MRTALLQLANRNLERQNAWHPFRREKLQSDQGLEFAWPYISRKDGYVLQ